MATSRYAMLVLTLCTFILSACFRPTDSTPQPVPTSPPPASGPMDVSQLTSEDIEHLIGAEAVRAVAALETADLPALADLAHPVKGIRFSPYGHVIVDGPYAHAVFSAEQLRDPAIMDKRYYWGIYDGSGHDIILDFDEFLAQFAYNKDYAKATAIGWNEVIGTGNTAINHTEVYPESVFVEYFDPGTDELDGMDWGSLRIVFEQYDGSWYVVAIIHDQWTI